MLKGEFCSLRPLALNSVSPPAPSYILSAISRWQFDLFLFDITHVIRKPSALSKIYRGFFLPTKSKKGVITLYPPHGGAF